jgi:hypothetical protein
MKNIPILTSHPITGEKLYTQEELTKLCRADLETIAEELYVKLQAKKSRSNRTYA